MRHEVPVAIGDDFIYVERNGTRVAVVLARDDRPSGGNGLDVRAVEHFGYDDLIASGIGRDEAFVEIALRACREARDHGRGVPAEFPVAVADHLRANGVELAPTARSSTSRRRSRTRRRSPVSGAPSARPRRRWRPRATLLRRAERGRGVLLLDGEPLTCERIKGEVGRVFSDHNTVAEEMIVSHGAQTAVGHDAGSGPIAPGEPIVLDLFPRDRESAAGPT